MNSITRTLPFAAGVARDVIGTFAAAAFNLPGRGVDILLLWEARLKERHQLARTEMHLLNDMGMTPEDAVSESRKPFWQS